MPAELRKFLHDLIDATAGAGTADRLHAALDDIGKVAAVTETVAADVVKAVPFS